VTTAETMSLEQKSRC